MKTWKKLLACLLALTALAGCAAQTPPQDTDQPDEADQAYIDQVSVAEEVEIEDEAVALADAPVPAVPGVLATTASGTQTKKNSRVTIDYSNTKDGYVMVNCSGGGKKLKVIVYGPSYGKNGTKYTYNLNPGEWTTFPLSDGNGSYKVGVYENTTGNKYATLLTADFSVSLTDEFAPFLRPNQYVNFTENSRAVQVAAEEIAANDATDNLSKTGVIYDYVVKNLSYDTAKAKSVKYDYLPDIDKVLSEKKGICFDYAALMAAMLRSQGVPIKLVVGYTSKNQKHAWINVWSEDGGWVDGMIYFNGKDWELMDPTFASSGKQSKSIMEYIGNGKNYLAKYLY